MRSITNRDRPSTWEQALGEHSKAMRAASRSRLTVDLYHGYVRQVADRHPDPWTVTQGDLEAYIGQDGWNAQSRQSARSALRSFYRWAHGRGFIVDDPSFGLPSISVPKGRKRWPAPELVVSQLIDDPRQPERVRFMGELAALAGLRVCEIAQVRGTDVDDAGRLVVTGKGGKTRMVPITDDTLLDRLRALGDAWAFPNGKGGHLTPRRVSELLADALPGRWTAHTLRHRFATKAHEEIQDLFALAELLGHANIETTRVYVLTSDDRLRAVVSAAGRPTAQTA